VAKLFVHVDGHLGHLDDGLSYWIEILHEFGSDVISGIKINSGYYLVQKGR
jgi:hypothetical protein